MESVRSDQRRSEPGAAGFGQVAAVQPTMARGPRAMGSQVADLADGVVGSLERSKSLDAFAQALGGVFSKVVQPGKVKDLLSGTWMGHAAHPMLTDVTIGSWTSSLFLDLLGGRGSAAADELVGVGLLAAMPTAVTGLSDLADLGTESERALGGAHAAGNLTAVALYGASYLARRAGSRRMGIALSLAGAAVMTGAAFLGGHLTLRKGIGVDHTAFEQPVEDWTPVLADAELVPGEPRLVQAAGNDVMLYRSAGGSILALANRCNHAGGPLNEGAFEEGRVTCPWHASMFNLADGSLARGPATAPQPSYEARVRDNQIEVRSRSRA